MEPQNARAPFDWYNYIGALLRGALVAAVASAAVQTLLVIFLKPIPLPEHSHLAILGFVLQSIFSRAMFFVFIFIFSSLIAFVATLVFGSAILLLVRGTRLLSVFTFAAAGFVFGYLMLIVFAYSTNAGVNIDALVYSFVGGVAGLAGGYGFGHRITHPVSKDARFSGYSK